MEGESVEKLSPWSEVSFRRKPESRIHKGTWIFCILNSVY